MKMRCMEIHVSIDKKLLFSAVLAFFSCGPGAHAAEFEVVDRFSVDGYAVLRGSADIPGGGFAVGLSSFTVQYGKVGIGTAAPASKLHISSGTLTIDGDTPNSIIVSGNVGIGTTNPAANLDVAGGIKVSSVTSCSFNTAGTLRWYDGHISVCNGAAWRQLDNQAPPTITSVNPPSGLYTLTTAVTITGTGFNQGLEVLVDGVTATNITAVSATQITATAPAGSIGTKVLKITNPDGQYVTGNFTYNPLPTVTGITPTSGSGIGGTPITITGTGFIPGVTRVTIGANDATSVARVSDTQLTAVTPANAASGVKTVTVINSDTGSAANSSPGFTYMVYATGGSITTVSSYRIHTFTTSGAVTFATAGNVEYLVVAGGGSGGGSGGTDGSGGGGAGGFRTASGFAVNAQEYTVTVGAGGNGVAANTDGNNGGNSVFSTITALGGGGGGSEVGSVRKGKDGGSGGGGGGYSGTKGFGTSGQGNDGANCQSPGDGGGGGAGAAGSAQNGGDGAASSITGSAVYYAGGGGASGDPRKNGGVPGSGGNGGGGAGAYATSGSAAPGNGGTNTGGGGGGPAGSTPVGASRTSGSGGSGIVIIRYPI